VTARTILFLCIGIFDMTLKKCKIKDYEKDYPDYSDKKE